METPYVQQLCVLDGLMVELCTLDQWLRGCGDTTYMMSGVIWWICSLMTIVMSVYS